MSNLDELYKESDIKETYTADSVRVKKRIISVVIYVSIYAATIYVIYKKGGLGEGIQPYYLLIIIAVFLYIAMKKITAIGNLFYRVLKNGDIK